MPIHHGTIRAIDLRQIKTGPDDFGLMSYDPAFLNTAVLHEPRSPTSTASKGILRYRGYPIEQLAEKCSYLEVAYLLLYGELPTTKQYDEWVHNITWHTMIHESLKKLMDALQLRRASDGDADRDRRRDVHVLPGRARRARAAPRARSRPTA